MKRTFVLEVPAGVSWHLWPATLARWCPAPVPQTEPLTPAPGRVDCWEITWNTPAPGRRALPLRLTRSEALDALSLCRNRERPVSWCLIDLARMEVLRLLERLTTYWGQGIACVDRRCRTVGDHGLALDEAARVQQHCQMRVWLGTSYRLDPFRVRAALRHGCLPIQFVSAEDYPRSQSDLPSGLRGFLLPLPAGGPLPVLTPADINQRLTDGLSVLLAGTLERDLDVRSLRGKDAA